MIHSGPRVQSLGFEFWLCLRGSLFFPFPKPQSLPVNGAWNVSEGPCHFSPRCVFSTLSLGFTLQRLRLWAVRLTAAEVEPPVH